MIQRIQSIYLFIAVIIAGVFSFINQYALQWINTDNIIASLTSLTAMLASIIIVVSIFLFKNRKLQIKLINFVLILILISIGFYVFIDGISNFFLDWQFYMLPILFVFLFLARRAVSSDEKMVQSSNRLR